MARQFSDLYLYAIRNHIPINFIINDVLCLPSKISDGIYRFRCPLCGELNTGIKHETNLSRCFLCKVNFNTIEIVMAVKKSKFIPAVKLLGKYLRKNSSGKLTFQKEKNRIENLLISPQTQNNSKREKSNDSPLAIGQIIPGLVSEINSRVDQNDVRTPYDTLLKRVESMEKKYDKLCFQVEKLHQLLRPQ